MEAGNGDVRPERSARRKRNQIRRSGIHAPPSDAGRFLPGQAMRVPATPAFVAWEASETSFHLYGARWRVHGENDPCPPPRYRPSIPDSGSGRNQWCPGSAQPGIPGHRTDRHYGSFAPVYDFASEWLGHGSGNDSDDERRASSSKAWAYFSRSSGNFTRPLRPQLVERQADWSITLFTATVIGKPP